MFTFWVNESIVFALSFIRSEGWKKSHMLTMKTFWFMIFQISVMTSFKREILCMGFTKYLNSTEQNKTYENAILKVYRNKLNF